MRRSGVAAALTGFLVLAHVAAGAAEPVVSKIAVIVGQKSLVTHVSVDDLRELYLRRTRLWPNGTRAVPINLPADNPLREHFSRVVLGRSTQDLVPYWNARYFEGITPPTVLPSSAAIRGYLAAEPAAIAYVPLEEVKATVRTLLVLER